MLIPRRPVPSSALSDFEESCRPATNLIGEANSTVHHRERGVVMAEQPVNHSTLEVSGSEQTTDYSTLEVSGSDYSGALNAAVTQPKADLQPNLLGSLESSSASSSTNPGKKEWIPTMLGKWPAFSLALALFLFVGLLEYFERLSRER